MTDFFGPFDFCASPPHCARPAGRMDHGPYVDAFASRPGPAPAACAVRAQKESATT